MHKISPPLQGVAKKRKYSGRVKRACENCKKAKRCCDNGRPCIRCQRLGIEDSCRDAERKERQDSPRPTEFEIPEKEPIRIRRLKMEPHSLSESVSSSFESLSDILEMPESAESLTPDSDIWNSNEPTFFLEDEPEQLFCDNFFSWCETDDDRKTQMIEKYHRLIEEVKTFKFVSVMKKEHSNDFHDFLSRIVSFSGALPYEYDFIISSLFYRLSELDRTSPDQILHSGRFLRNETGVLLLKQGQLMHWNRAVCDMLGYSELSLPAGICWRRFLAPSEWNKMENHIRSCRTTDFTQSFTFVDKIGRPLEVRASFVPIYNPAYSVVLADSVSTYMLVCLNPVKY